MNRQTPSRCIDRPTDGGIRTRWFDRWNATLEGALAALPEMDSCPHPLFRLLATVDPHSKRFALVEDRHACPLAVVGLRFRPANRDFVLLTHYTVPGALFPAKEGFLLAAISSLGVNLRIAWWRMGEFRGDIRGLRSVEVYPTYGLDLTTDYKAHWRSGHRNEVLRQRRKCEGLQLQAGVEGMTEWVIRNCERKWRAPGDAARPDLNDKILAARYLEDKGKAMTFSISEGERPVGGVTNVAHGDCLVIQHVYRDPAYDALGVGTVLFDASIEWAAAAGYRSFDLGGEHEYKKKWGPVTGSKTVLHLCPGPLYWAGRARQTVRHALHRAFSRPMSGAAQA